MDANVLWTVGFSAIVVETIVNIIRNINAVRTDNGEAPTWKYWTALGVSIFLGVLVSVVYDVDLFSAVGMEARVPFVGAVLTGLVLSRGSNIVSDVVDRLNSWRSLSE
jgi:hypothetical protein